MCQVISLLCGWIEINVFHKTELSALIYISRIQSTQKDYALATEILISSKKRPSSMHTLCKKQKLCANKELLALGLCSDFESNLVVCSVL